MEEGPFYCECCGRRIPEEVIRKRKSKDPPHFYNREHFTRWRRARGFYTRFSGYGLLAQAKIKRETGEWPGAAKKREELSKVRHLSRRNSKQSERK